MSVETGRDGVTTWDGEDRRTDRVRFSTRKDFGPNGLPYVTVEAASGYEFDPAELSPADARRAADEWPAILRRLADEAEGVVSP